MASILLSSRLASPLFMKQGIRAISDTKFPKIYDVTKFIKVKGTVDVPEVNPFVNKDIILSHPVDNTIQIDKPSSVAEICGVPEEHRRGRMVRIFMPSKNTMQSGTDNIHEWTMEFDTRERWENPLMGWTSSGDPLSNMQLQFVNQSDAIAFCEKNDWPWYIHAEPQKREERPKSYGVNFSWNKRTRVSTK